MDFHNIEFIDTRIDKIKAEAEEYENDNFETIDIPSKANIGDNHIKCGEIFTVNNFDFILICGFCGVACDNIIDFGNHIHDKHAADPVSTLDHIKEEARISLGESFFTTLPDVNDEQLPTSSQDESVEELSNLGQTELKKRKRSRAKCKTCGKTFCNFTYIRKYHKCEGVKKPAVSTKKFTCTKCIRSFQNFKSLKNHKCKAKHSDDFDLRSPTLDQEETQSNDKSEEKCSTTQPEEEEENLDDQMDPKAVDNRDLFCDICQHQFRKKSIFRRHAIDHDKPCEAIKRSPGYLRCQYCNVKFTNMVDWREHEKSHTEEDPFACPHCSKRFKRLTYLEMHVNSHTGNKPYKCKECPRAFAHNMNLLAHVRRVHRKIMPFACEICGKKHARNCELTVHMRSHTGERSFQCEECGKSFVKFFKLQQHKKRHTNTKDVLCPHCNRGFYTYYDMQRHSVKHFDDRPFSCEVCGSTFKRRRALAYHKKLHLDKKEYVCTICGKEFAQPAGLYSHKKSHAIADFNFGPVEKVL